MTAAAPSASPDASLDGAVAAPRDAAALRAWAGEGAVLPDEVRRDVEAALSAAHGGGVRARPLAWLSSRISPVWRVALDGPPGTPETVIVKHLAPPWYGRPVDAATPRDFQEEAAAYAFFEGLRERAFHDRARRLAWLPAGALVLEDLGASDRSLPPARVGDLLAVAFARLHAATAGRRAAHDEARRALGIDPTGADDRYDGVDAATRRFARGRDALAGWSEALGVASAADLVALLDAVEAAVLAPGPFHALVHDDVANARQCVVRGGRLLLIDWENAKHAHALRDVAKVLVGKFEQSLEAYEMIRVCPEMEPTLSHRYRRELARAGGPDVDDATWGRELCGAVLFNTVVQVGSLVGLHAVAPVAGQVLPNLRDIVFRMGEVLHGQAGWEDPRRILLLLAGRIA